MRYKIERYKNRERFNEQYQSIHQFILEAEKLEYNEHFHWGRFEWMHAHSYLDEEKLTSIVMFKDENNIIVGLTTYDTCYDDRVYLIHSSSDKLLLESMIDIVTKDEGGRAILKVNAKDTVLCQVLREKGFDNEGIPEKWDDELLKRIPNANEDLKTFAIANKNNEYCAHCGLWYLAGDTAYVEPVLTVPEHRRQGLAKAVIYEACARAKALGAKRAIVVSEQEFYFRIGFTLSSEVYDWTRNN